MATSSQRELDAHFSTALYFGTVLGKMHNATNAGLPFSEGLKIFDSEWEQIRHCATWLCQTYMLGERYARLLNDYFIDGSKAFSIRFSPIESMDWLNCILEATRTFPDHAYLQCHILINLAFTSFTQLSQFDKAYGYLREAKQIANRYALDDELREVEEALATLLNWKGDSKQAVEALEWLQIGASDEGRGLDAQSTSWKRLGEAYLFDKRYDDAADCFNKALQLARKVGDQAALSDTYIGFSLLYWHQKDLDKAIKYGKHALKLAKQCGYRDGEVTMIGNLGAIYVSKRNYKKAFPLLQQALEMNVTYHDKLGQANALQNLGNCYALTWQLAKAIDCLVQARSLFQEIGLPNRATNLDSVIDSVKRRQMLKFWDV